MTNQEMFDKVVAGLAAQNFEQAYDSDVGCMYRAPDGKKCAMGQLLPDELYSRSFEGKLAQDVITATGLDMSVEFAGALQDAHDAGRFDMKDRLRKAGEKFGLTIPEVLR